MARGLLSWVAAPRGEGGIMAIHELSPARDDIIRPVLWDRTRTPGFSDDDPRLTEIADKLGQEGQYYVPELQSVAEDSVSPSRYLALGYLVAIQHRGKLDTDDLIGFLERLARTATRDIREDSLWSLAHLRGEHGYHSAALGRLIALATDPSFADARLDALTALATTR